MNVRMVYLSVVVSVVASTSCSSCLSGVTNSIDDATTKTVGVLQDGIDKITGSMSSWQQVLQDMQGKLTADAQSTIRNEVTSLLQGSIAMANASLQCDVDFIGHRVVQTLRRLVSKLTGETAADLLEPASCSAVPAGIEFKAWQSGSVPKLDIFGYDFDANDITLWLFTGGNKTNITSRLSRISKYQFSVTLGGNPPLFSGAAQEIHLVWKNDFAHAVSEIPVLLPVTPVCQARKKTIPQIASISYTPPRVAGDREFSGHGPDVWTSVNLSVIGGSTLQASIYMRARETESDWSEARGTLTRTVYSSDPGWRIDRLLTPANASDYFRDDNHTLDKRQPGGAVSRLEIVGDTDGDDIGETGVTVFFTSVDVWEIQNKDCVSPSNARALIDAGNLSEEARTRLNNALRTVPLEAFPRPR